LRSIQERTHHKIVVGVARTGDGLAHARQFVELTSFHCLADDAVSSGLELTGL